MKKTLSELKSIVRECEGMAYEAGIDTGIIAEVRINSRAKKRWGLCTRLVDGTFAIEISDRLLEDTIEEDALYNTVMHEVLHTSKDCLNHGKLWKEHAETINRIYGLNVKRCTSAEEKNLQETTDEDTNYIVMCPKCGYQWKYIRLTKCVKNPKRYTHNGCNVSLVRVR